MVERKLINFTINKLQLAYNIVHCRTSYGYPDPTYLQRVKKELAAKGIFPDP